MIVVTRSGRFLDCNNPNPADIQPADIAYQLEYTYRWRAATIRPLSVAEHSIWVALAVSPENQLAALLHDAAEAFMSDVPTPIKKHCHSYMSIEANLLGAILERFGLPPELPQEVLEADFRMACTEKAKLLPAHVQSHPSWSHMEGAPIYEGIDFGSFEYKPGMFLETLEMMRHAA